jgi:DNA topoisomerase-2
MYLFDAQGRIKKYDTIADIVFDFFTVRLAAYGSRKQHVLAASARAIQVLAEKVRFLQDVVSGALQVTALSKAGLEERLEALGYQRIDKSYDHLIRMPIYSLTEDKKRELEEELAQKQRAHDAYAKKTPCELWQEDLAALKALLVA